MHQATEIHLPVHKSIEQGTDKLALFCTAFDKMFHFHLNIYTLFKGRIGKAIVIGTHLLFINIYNVFVSSFILIKSMQNFEENVQRPHFFQILESSCQLQYATYMELIRKCMCIFSSQCPFVAGIFFEYAVTWKHAFC